MPITDANNDMQIEDNKRERARRILDDAVILQITISKPGMSLRLTEIEKRIIASRSEKQRAEWLKLQGIEVAEAEADAKPAKRSRKPKADAEPAGEFVVSNLDHISMSKQLLNRNFLRPVRALDAQMKAYLKGIRLETSILGGGRHLIPLVYADEVVRRIEEFIVQRQELVMKAVEEYPAVRDEMITMDPEMYKLSDYPSPQAFADHFKVDYSLKSENVPQKLGQIDTAILQREMTKAEEKWKDVGDEIADGLKTSLAVLMEDVQAQLGYSDGKPRIFRDSMIEKVDTWLKVFEGRNALAGDAELPQMVAKLRDVMSGVSAPDQLRKDMSLRDTIRETAESLGKELAASGVVVKRRVLRAMEDEDDE